MFNTGAIKTIEGALGRFETIKRELSNGMQAAEAEEEFLDARLADLRTKRETVRTARQRAANAYRGIEKLLSGE